MMPRSEAVRAAASIDFSSPACPPHATFAASINDHSSPSAASHSPPSASPRSQLSSIMSEDEDDGDDERDQRDHTARTQERIVITQVHLVRAAWDGQRLIRDVCGKQ